MSNTQRIEKSIRSNKIKGYLLSIITIPFVPILVLKIIYNVPGDSAINEGFRSLVSESFQLGYVKFMWPITPNASTASIVTFDNLLALLILGGFMFGGYLIGKAKKDRRKLDQAEEEAEKLKLIDEFRRN